MKKSLTAAHRVQLASGSTMIAAVAIVLAVVGLCACGGGGGIPGDAVAQVGSTAITKAELNHWMSTITGGDFYEVSRKHAVPAGLVADPPNYAACVARLESAAASAAQTKSVRTVPALTSAQLLSKCRDLYIALRLQAMRYLIEARWEIAVYAELGVTATDAEVQHKLEQIKHQEFAVPGQFQNYLATTRRSLADELLVTKLNVLSEKVQQKAAGVGIKQITRKISEAGLRWTSKTSCRPGYVVPHCREFKKWVTLTRDPAVLLEQVATITGIPCVNREGCG